MMQRVTAFMNRIPVVVVMTLISIGLAAWSISSVVTALEVLEAKTSTIELVSQTWELQPLVGITFVQGVNAQCPTSHPEVLSRWSFPGVKAGMCTCQIGAFAVVDNERIEQFSSPGQCSENQKKTLPPCAEDPEIGAISMSQWGDAGVICGVRGGEAVVNTGPEVVLRPEPSDSGTCPTGYQVCGTGSRDTASKICFPAASACPVTDLGAVTSTPTASEFPGLTGTGYSNESQQFLFGWQNPAAAAVISLTVGLGGVCEGSSSGLSYEQSSANLDRLVSRKTSDECALGLDARWQSWAALTEQQVLVANFANNSDWCGPTTRNQFAFQGFAGDHSPLNCADSDAQCLGVINRTRCSKLLSYSNPAQASAASKPTLYFIREVGWKHDCASDRKTFLLGIRGLAAIPENQRTVTIINIASNTVNILLLLLVLAEIFVFPCIWEGRKYDPTNKKGYLPVLKVVSGAVSKLVRFIPLVIFVASLASVVTAITDASNASCTDSETQKQLSLMSTTLVTGLASNIVTLVLDVVLVVQAGLSLYWLFSSSSE
ncbi:hypothetical protein FNF27_07872 [Cafeteria roenbergensis]|uniref:Uncharacterized protein n=1 Tax=Cafeteria roenbergensis TaxID=33653 RepID=A0A5A8D1G1_CAFRO|nr:hypothetical protein FNF28_06251 [Cafeteria roenbergensis]KAA0159075.1 hypothetical protein FNF31_05027 [Cafeteria roenbergensis]KAA0163914.1 hypothetical protein FNF27_07872 [Cafeteria roenbergensis]